MTPPAPTRAAPHAGPGSATAGAVRPAGIDADPRRLRFAVAAEPCAAAQARRMTRTWLTNWQMPDETCDSAALVVSELVTNAIVHTSSRQIMCELTDESNRVRITVGDEGCTSDAPPRHSSERDGEEHGRGLLLVAATCSAWGAHERGPGLQVWAELPYPADHRTTADHRTGIEADTVRGTGAEWVS